MSEQKPEASRWAVVVKDFMRDMSDVRVDIVWAADATSAKQQVLEYLIGPFVIIAVTERLHEEPKPRGRSE